MPRFSEGQLVTYKGRTATINEVVPYRDGGQIAWRYIVSGGRRLIETDVDQIKGALPA